MREHGFVIAGQQKRSAETFEVRNPFDASLVATLHNAGPADIEISPAVLAPASSFRHIYLNATHPDSIAGANKRVRRIS